MQIPIFVISLERATDRRADILARLDAARFQYTIARWAGGLCGDNGGSLWKTAKAVEGRKTTEII